MSELLAQKRSLGARVLQIALIILPVAAVALQWVTDTVQWDHLVFEVRKVTEIAALETRYLYLYLHLFALIPVLALSFDRRVHYYTYWRALLPAMFIVAIFFWIWDVYKTAVGVWGFNPAHYTFLLLNLPIEEWLFFFTFPFASVFIYECLNHYFPQDRLALLEPYLTPVLIVFFLLIGFAYWSHAYTSTTFLLCSGFWLYHYIYMASEMRSRFYNGLLIGYIPFVLVNGVLTGAFTQAPVVVYNPDEYLGLRLVSIPLDDFAYNFLLQAMVITLYEYFKKKMGMAGTFAKIR